MTICLGSLAIPRPTAARVVCTGRCSTETDCQKSRFKMLAGLVSLPWLVDGCLLSVSSRGLVLRGHVSLLVRTPTLRISLHLNIPLQGLVTRHSHTGGQGCNTGIWRGTQFSP